MGKLRKASRLKYGQTPWDNLDKEQLLLLVCRYHSALESCRSVIRMIGHGQESNPYFGPEGVAGSALAKAEFLHAMSGENTDAGSEKIYRMFYRSANGVLFPGLKMMTFGDWYICEKCGQMCAGTKNPPTRFCKCDALWRPFTLADIRPDLANVKL